MNNEIRSEDTQLVESYQVGKSRACRGPSYSTDQGNSYACIKADETSDSVSLMVNGFIENE